MKYVCLRSSSGMLEVEVFPSTMMDDMLVVEVIPEYLLDHKNYWTDPHVLVNKLVRKSTALIIIGR